MAIFKFCLFCLILVLAGCGKTSEQTVTEKKSETASGAETKVDVQKNEITIAAETAGEKYTASSGEGAEIPKDFPADVFIYRPSQVITTMDMPEGSVLGLKSADAAAKVAETYQREMTAMSWSEQTAVNNGAQVMLVYEKQDRIANITIGSMDDAVQIMVTVTKD